MNTCSYPGCNEIVENHEDYVCGAKIENEGCGKLFCSDHLLIAGRDFYTGELLCDECYDKREEQENEEDGDY